MTNHIVHFQEFTFVGATTNRNGVVEFYARVRDTTGQVRGLAYDDDFNRYFETFAEAKAVCDRYEAGPDNDGGSYFWDYQTCDWRFSGEDEPDIIEGSVSVCGERHEDFHADDGL